MDKMNEIYKVFKPHIDRMSDKDWGDYVNSCIEDYKEYENLKMFHSQMKLFIKLYNLKTSKEE